MEELLKSNKACAVSLTKQGNELLGRLKKAFPNNDIDYYTLKRWAQGEMHPIEDVGEFFKKVLKEYDTIIAVMAAGIVAREMGPLLENKASDPGVLVVDAAGEHVVSLISGHLGRANDNAAIVARVLGATPVITTASDQLGKASVDSIAQSLNAGIESLEDAKNISALIIEDKKVALLNDSSCKEIFVDGLEVIPVQNYWDDDKRERINPKNYDGLIILTDKLVNPALLNFPYTILRPKEYVIGIGCRKGVTKEKIIEQIETLLKGMSLSPGCLDTLATITRKGDEPGIKEAAAYFNCGLKTFTPEEIEKTMHLFHESKFVKKTVGVGAVSVPCGYLASGHGVNLINYKGKGITLSLWRKAPAGKLSVVGIGPGSVDHLTQRAVETLKEADCIIGYETYIDLIQSLTGLETKRFIRYGMGEELKRVEKAVELARDGVSVALISSGDPGVYGMAAPLIESLDLNGSGGFELEIIPGVTAAAAAAATVGAPLSNDFCFISLSDLLTPWEVIEKRLKAAGKGDFVVALYNPKGKSFSENLEKAVNILLKYRKPDTVVSVVRSVTRENESIRFTVLEKLPEEEVGMDTIVIVGNSQSKLSETTNLFYTRRGYKP